MNERIGNWKFRVKISSSLSSYFFYSRAILLYSLVFYNTKMSRWWGKQSILIQQFVPPQVELEFVGNYFPWNYEELNYPIFPSGKSLPVTGTSNFYPRSRSLKIPETLNLHNDSATFLVKSVATVCPREFSTWDGWMSHGILWRETCDLWRSWATAKRTQNWWQLIIAC